MNKKEERKQKFHSLEGQLEKLSSSIFLGYQKKFWRIFDEGKKIGYRNLDESEISAKNTFDIKYCTASQISGDGVFQLVTEERTFTLKAPSEDEKNAWIRAISHLRKLMFRAKTKKPEPSPTETTLASHAERVIAEPPKKHKKTNTSTSFNCESPLRKYTPEDIGIQTSDKSIIQELLTRMPQKYLKYHTLLAHLKTKGQGLIASSLKDDIHLLVSPKSLYPDVHISDQNLSYSNVPSWLEINKFYRIRGKERKQIFEVGKILSVEPSKTDCSFKVNTGEIIYEYFTDTSIEMECVCSCLENAIINASQVMIKGQFKKKNYDRLIDYHQTEIQAFKDEARNMLAEFVPNQEIHKYQPEVLIEFMEDVIIFLRQFTAILENKKKDKNHVILDMLIIFHEEVKIQVKLTWDSSFSTIKAIHVLKILRCLSEYYEVVNPFIKSTEFHEGMVELSKIYVRTSWKNFESIIHNIVEQEKSDNFFQDDHSNYIETNGVNDLFKFIYDVFDLAHPHWKSKIHLHNVNRLMQRALVVFINEVKSAIDEQVIPEKQMVALANNYFRFSQCVNQFYEEKFQSQLAERTKQSYDKIIASYKQVSMIVIDKLVSSVRVELQRQCQGKGLLTVKIETLIKIICIYYANYEKLVHMAFMKKLHEKLVGIVHITIVKMLCWDAKKKKKMSIKEILKHLQLYKKEFCELFAEMSKMHLVFAKKMEEIENVLSLSLYVDIEAIIAATNEPMKGLYLKVMEFRDDFSPGSALQRFIMQKEQAPRIKKTTTKYRKTSVDIRSRGLTKQYIEQEDADDQASQNGQTIVTEMLISEGYMMKGKRNHKVWEKEYFRLKNGFLYFYEHENADRCRNSIDLKNLIRIDIYNPDKPSFLLAYRNLGKQKQIKLKCENMEMRDRWISSFQLEKKRLENEKEIKKKAIRLKETGRKKNQLIIDYEELEKGKDYFSYAQ